MAPYAFSSSVSAVYWSVGLTLLALLVLGAFNAHLFKVRLWRDAILTLAMGGLAIVVGVVVGQVANHF